MKKLLPLILFLMLFSPLRSSAVAASTAFEGALGLQLTAGDVNSTLIRTNLLYNFNRKWNYEWTAKLRSDFQRTEDQELVSKHLGSLRFGKSINKSWYWFSRFDAEKDAVRSLDARYGLVIGTGYWFSDTDDFKFLVESSTGRYSDHLTDQSVEDYYVLQGREELDKKIIDTLWLKQEFFATNLKNGNRYLADLALENSLAENWLLVASLNYDLAVYDDGTRSENTVFLMELKFAYERQETGD
jgi:hypothetical protein